MWNYIKLTVNVICWVVQGIINDIRYKPKYAIFEASFLENKDLATLHNPENGHWVEVVEHPNTVDVIFYRTSTDKVQISPPVSSWGYTFIKHQLKPETLNNLRLFIRQ